MQFKRGTLFILSIVMLLLLTCPTGCGDSNDSHYAGNQHTLLGDEEPFYGSLLNNIIGGLVQGAEQKAGYQALGEILELLGWGSSDQSEVLNAMNQKLTRAGAGAPLH